jgi:DNA-directed RNA polymerase subunit RPC12/RpoP
MTCNVCRYQAAAMCFYFVWYPGCPGPEPEEKQAYRCPECGSKDLEEPHG